MTTGLLGHHVFGTVGASWAGGGPSTLPTLALKKGSPISTSICSCHLAMAVELNSFFITFAMARRMAVDVGRLRGRAAWVEYNLLGEWIVILEPVINSQAWLPDPWSLQYVIWFSGGSRGRETVCAHGCSMARPSQPPLNTLTTHDQIRTQHITTDMSLNKQLDSVATSSASINDVCHSCGSIISSAPRAHRHTQRESDPIKKPRKRRRTPASLECGDVRADVKIAMIAAIPGVSAAKAAALLEECEGSFARLVGASSTELANVHFEGKPVGETLGVAIWRALH